MPAASLAQVDAAAASVSSASGPIDAAQEAYKTLDPADTADDLTRRGYVAGYEHGLNWAAGKVLALTTGVLLFHDAAAAEAFVASQADIYKRFAGEPIPPLGLVASDTAGWTVAGLGGSVTAATSISGVCQPTLRVGRGRGDARDARDPGDGLRLHDSCRVARGFIPGPGSLQPLRIRLVRNRSHGADVTSERTRNDEYSEEVDHRSRSCRSDDWIGRHRGGRNRIGLHADTECQLTSAQVERGRDAREGREHHA